MSVGIPALGLNSFVKYAVVVDEEIDIYDERNVLWAISNRVRADEDIVIIPNAKGNRLDPMTYTRMRTSRDSMVTKMVIDATTKTGLPYEVAEPVVEPLIDKIDSRRSWHKSLKPESRWKMASMVRLKHFATCFYR